MDKPTRWSSRTAFIFATAAAAVGLGNIWRFPYLAGEYGGGAFVLLYILCVIGLGIPLMMSEMILGRLGRKNPAGSLAAVAKQVGHSRRWGLLGALTVLAGFLILSYYLVISGWVVDYFGRSLAAALKQTDQMNNPYSFMALKANPWEMFFCDTGIALASMGVILLGIKKGLERVVLFMFPTLFLLLFVLLAYSATTPGFHEAFDFLLKPNLAHVSGRTLLLALGQAFFSLNIAMGITIMFSAYLPDQVSIPKSVVAVALADTLIALLAGFVIFPIVFTHHLQPTAGPSLIFQTLPIAFTEMPGGYWVGSLFFLLLLFAAFTSAIALLETSVAWLVEQRNVCRKKATLLAGTAAWIVSFGTLLSFSPGKHVHFFDLTFYQAVDFVTSSIMLPIGGLLTAVFAGWFVSRHLLHDTLGWNTNTLWFRCWQLVNRYIAPIAIVLILITSFGLL